MPASCERSLSSNFYFSKRGDVRSDILSNVGLFFRRSKDIRNSKNKNVERIQGITSSVKICLASRIRSARISVDKSRILSEVVCISPHLLQENLIVFGSLAFRIGFTMTQVRESIIATFNSFFGKKPIQNGIRVAMPKYLYKYFQCSKWTLF